LPLCTSRCYCGASDSGHSAHGHGSFVRGTCVRRGTPLGPRRCNWRLALPAISVVPSAAVVPSGTQGSDVGTTLGRWPIVLWVWLFLC
jgi:hypothetical protein